MADTRDDVVVPEGVWTDLYAATTIAVGTAVSVYNKGSVSCVLATKATAPTSIIGLPLYVGTSSNFACIDAGETGLWCYCPQGTTRLLVQE